MISLNNEKNQNDSGIGLLMQDKTKTKTMQYIIKEQKKNKNINNLAWT